MTLNPWKRIRELKKLVSTQLELIASMKTLLEVLQKTLTIQAARITELTTEKTPVADPGLGGYVN